MEAYLVFNGGLNSIALTRAEVREVIQNIFDDLRRSFNSLSGSHWTRRAYSNDVAYASHSFGIKIFEVDLFNLKNLPINWVYSSASVEGVRDVTSSFYTIENTLYEGNLKLFATVTKTGLKSTGLTVLIDPQLSGSEVREPSYYEDMIGTFARVKATTEINAGWSPVLFFSPDSLGDYRIETQQLAGRIVIFGGE